MSNHSPDGWQYLSKIGEMANDRINAKLGESGAFVLYYAISALICGPAVYFGCSCGSEKQKIAMAGFVMLFSPVFVFGGLFIIFCVIGFLITLGQVIAKIIPFHILKRRI